MPTSLSCRSLLFTLALLLSISIMGQNPFIKPVSSSFNVDSAGQLLINKISQDSNIVAYWVSEVFPFENYLNGEEFQLTLPDVVAPIVFRANYVLFNDSTNYMWTGLRMDGSSATIHRHPTGYTGNISLAQDSNFYYELSSLSTSHVILYKMKRDYTDDGCESGDWFEIANPDPNPDLQETSSVEDRSHVNCHTDEECTRIRVLFLITKGGKADALKTPDQMQSIVINQLNASSINSGLSIEDIFFEAATPSPLLIEMDEDDTARQTSKKMKNNDEVKNLRNEHFADIVCLFCANSLGTKLFSASGHGFNNADCSESFACARVNKVDKYMKMTHGIGHIIGADHQLCWNCCNTRCSPRCDWEDLVLQLIPPVNFFDHLLDGIDGCWPTLPGCQFDHGLVLNEDFRTIMADCGTQEKPARVFRWSSPEPFSLPNGTTIPAGGPDLASDNANELRKNAANIAGFRPPPAESECSIESQFQIFGDNKVCAGSSHVYASPISGGTTIWYKSSNGVSYTQIATGISIYLIIDPSDAPSFYLRAVSILNGVIKVGFMKITVPSCSQGNLDRNKEEGDITDIYNFEVFPNPTEGQISISGTKISDLIQVIDLKGKVILQEKGHSNPTFDLRRIDKGIYFIRVISVESVETRKIIIR